MNFKAIYNSIVSKLSQGTDKTKIEKGFKVLESKITKTSALSKQFIVYETIHGKKNITEEAAKNQVMFLEKYCSKLNYSELEEANLDLCKTFNINPSTIISSDLDSAIDEMLRMTGGGTVSLTQGPQYRKRLLESFVSKPEESKKENKDLREFKHLDVKLLSEVACKAIGEAYNKLTLREQEVTDVAHSNDSERLKTKLEIVERLSRRLSDKHKPMMNECVGKLKEDFKNKSFEETVYKTYELREAVEKILEDEGDREIVIRLPDMKYLKKVKLKAEEKIAQPETIIISFQIDTYPLATSYAGMYYALRDLDKRFSRLGRTILNQTIFWKNRQGKFFTGAGIWDTLVREHGAQPGQKIPIRGELWLDIVDGKNYSLKDLKEPVMEILQDLDQKFPEWLPDTSKTRQEEFLAAFNAEKSGAAKSEEPSSYEKQLAKVKAGLGKKKDADEEITTAASDKDLEKAIVSKIEA